VRYYDIPGNWRRIREHIKNPVVQKVLIRDFSKYVFGRWQKPFTSGMLPAAFDHCDWRCDHPGRRPPYWQYAVSGACHWLVNFEMEVAKRVAPKQQWGIITSSRHSLVWDGDEMIFAFGFLAFGTPADKCFALAADEPDSRVLPVGIRRPVRSRVYMPA
jgi:hypothetical protein